MNEIKNCTTCMHWYMKSVCKAYKCRTNDIILENCKRWKKKVIKNLD